MIHGRGGWSCSGGMPMSWRLLLDTEIDVYAMVEITKYQAGCPVNEPVPDAPARH